MNFITLLKKHFYSNKETSLSRTVGSSESPYDSSSVRNTILGIE